MFQSFTLVLATASLAGSIYVATAGARPHQLYVQPGGDRPATVQALARRP